MDARYTVTPKPLEQTEAAPVRARMTEDGLLFLDFEKAAFGTLLVPASAHKLVVHLGEQLNTNGRLERQPAGTIRYIRIEQDAVPNEMTRLTIPPDKRNTGPSAIRMPQDIGEVFPFRYAEIEDGERINANAVRQVCVHYPFDDSASSFKSSDPLLNSVWDLCKYSIKATTFCGVYVDGDRERIPYEADAYINQLSHYCVDNEYALARYTHEYLIQHATWPTEWQLHSVMMAWADYMYTGETESLKAFYADLRVKTLIALARKDGLISTQTGLCTRELGAKLHLTNLDRPSGIPLGDLVDWPPGSFTEGGQGERDGHEMLPVNTVVNAFHCHALELMSRMASVTGHSRDAAHFKQRADLVKSSINRVLFDEPRGIYIDGEGSRHSSLHSNMFMLAFGLVPDDRQVGVIQFVKSRGMACSVYGAQYLLEALYLNSEENYAFELMTARNDRSWWNMMEAGSTITLEAWGLKYKNNLDWNHAWGAAPANIIPRFLLGVRPLEPGCRKLLIHPQPGPLSRAAGTIPTPPGSVDVDIETHPDGSRTLKVTIPSGTTAKVGLAPRGGEAASITADNETQPAEQSNGTLFLDNIEPGSHVFVVK